MLRRMMMLLALVLMPCAALAEDAAEAVASLREAKSIAEVEQFVLYPPEGGLADAKRGYIRYIAQHRANDTEYFRKLYWMGSPEGTELDLTEKRQANGEPYEYSVANMCTRAAYSMALSYLGIDMTPGDMSATTGLRDMDPPYEEISDLFGLERVMPEAHVFDTMMANYLSDPNYSPVYVYFRRPDGDPHAFLVVAALPQKSRFLVVDPSAMLAKGESHRVYMVAFNWARTEIDTSTFRYELRGGEVIGLYQWKLPTESY